MAFCGKCGTELRKGAGFCHRCGQKAGSATVPAAPRTAEPAPEPVSVPVPQPEPVYVPERGYPQEFYGPSCYYHTMEPAVVQCARCGKPICRDCAEISRRMLCLQACSRDNRSFLERALPSALVLVSSRHLCGTAAEIPVGINVPRNMYKRLSKA